MNQGPAPVEFSRTSAESLAGALRRRTHAEVRFDGGSRALYATDGSNYRQIPIGVVIPRTVDDVAETVAACREYGAPVLGRGGGTSLAGQCCNTAVVIDMSKYLRRVLEIDPCGRRAVVEPGCVLDDLRERAEQHHLTFGPDPSTHDHNTLGGMIGNNSCGVHSVMAGRTVDNVRALDILTYDGLQMRVGATDDAAFERIAAEGGRRAQIYSDLRRLRDEKASLVRERYPQIPRRVSGYNLDELLPEKGFNVARALVGTEGTCALVLRAELELVPSPPRRVLLVLGFRDVYCAADAVPQILEHNPLGLEGLDDRLIAYMRSKQMHEQARRMLPEGDGWLLVELGAESRREAEELGRRLQQALRENAALHEATLCTDQQQQQALWAVRKAALGATAHLPDANDTWPGWEDAAVPPEKLGAYLREFRELLERHGYECSLYGHFGDGCIHVRIDFDLRSAAGIAAYRAFTEDAAGLVVRYGGSFSGEHGDGQSRGELLEKMYGAELIEAFRKFKSIWDPDNRFNPGKVVDPWPRDANLRLRDYHPPQQRTAFSYSSKAGGFAEEMLRCVGVGTCRKMTSGVMCPSYMATQEEKHSTRGRARLLFELVHGLDRADAPINDGWKSDAVHEALDLCLACKGCLDECPVQVDMATYKAEFNYHYFRGRLRPRAAYSMGLIHWWSRLASRAPGIVNAALLTPGVREFAKAVAGIAAARQLPRFASPTFRHWYRLHPPRNEGQPEVLLWPDTFNNYQQPANLVAALEVLEDAGYRVRIPERVLCCARPLYDFGMLDLARRQLRQIMETLSPAIAEGTPVVGVEPSCVAAFRDELIKLFPEDERAQRLCRQVSTFGEFLAKHASHEIPPMRRRALVHVHCNQRAVMGLAGERQIMDAMGLDYEVLDAGCCGMAGAFGFESGHYDVSMRIGERVLLPAVREAESDTVIVADGYSCREQIAQATNRRAVHLAEVVRMASRERGAESGSWRQREPVTSGIK